MLKVTNYSLNYGENKIVNNVSFSLEKGKILGIVGPSGSGKTSLIKGLVGIYYSDENTITLNGERIYDNFKVKEDIAFVADENQSFYLITIREIINFYKSICKNFNEEKFHKINKLFKIPLNRRYLQLSKGMKARVNIMIAFSLESKLLVLDEPTSGLDPILKNTVMNLISKEVLDGEKSVIISSHNLQEIERVCDDILIIKDGQVEYNDSLKNIKKNTKKIQIAFDKPIYEEDLMFEGVTSIKSIGRVFTIIIEGNCEKYIENIKSHKPLFIEEIDLSLEEIFIHKLSKGVDYEEILK